MVTAIGQTNAAALPPPGVSGAGALRLWEALGRRIDGRDPRVAREAAAQLLSELFFGPLLAEMRRFPFGRELATGGFTEETFGQQLDQRVADTVAASQPALIKQVTKYLEQTQPRRGPRTTRPNAVEANRSTNVDPPWPLWLQLREAFNAGAA